MASPIADGTPTGAAPRPAPSSPNRRYAVVGATALVAVAVGSLIALTGGDDDGAAEQPSDSTVVVETVTTATTNAATTITAAATTAAETTTSVASVTTRLAITTVAPVVVQTQPTTAPVTLGAVLAGPTEATTGQELRWDVAEAPGATGGRWILTGPVTIGEGQDGWSPGNYFRGTWNVPCTCTLTLQVFDASGNAAFSNTITFVVSEPAT